MIVDVAVGRPERLIFEAPAKIEPPLVQDPVARRPVVFPGVTLDSVTACPPLTTFERAEVRRLQDNARRALADERNRILGERARSLADRHGITLDAARRIVDDQCHGIITSEMFDETGCVPGIDGEEVRAETMVPPTLALLRKTSLYGHVCSPILLR